MTETPERGKIEQVVLLAGGPGSRLGEIARLIPKPLLEVAGQPFVTHLIHMLSRGGLSKFLLLAGYRGEAVLEYCRGQAGLKALMEPEPLGTAGALRFAADQLADDFILANGDSLCLGDWRPLLAPLRRPESLGRLWLRRVERNDRYGEVLVEAGRVTGFRERAVASGGPGLMNAGVYHLSRKILAYIPEGKSSLEADVFPRLAAEGRLEAHITGPSYFIDIGVPEDLARARAELPAILKAWGAHS